MRGRHALWFGLLSVILLLAGAIIDNGFAQNYPTKPVRLILGFPPGGGVDIVARQITSKLGEQLGQSVVIDNRPGAAANIALDLLAHAVPDGYSLMLTTPTLTVNPSLYKNLAYDPINDFAPVSLVASTVYVLVVHPSLPVRSVKQLIALARARPRELSYSSGGNGSAAHLAGEMFKSMAKVDILHVPYKGIAPALVALLNGEAQLTFGTLPSTLPLVRNGKLRPLAVTGSRRTKFVPDLPTISEAGVPDYATTAWYGVIAPAKTPKAIVDRLNSELAKVLKAEEIEKRFAKQNIEVLTSTPEQFGEFIKAELAKWRDVVNKARMRID